jgi:hypothetical protein
VYGRHFQGQLTFLFIFFLKKSVSVFIKIDTFKVKMRPEMVVHPVIPALRRLLQRIVSRRPAWAT